LSYEVGIAQDVCSKGAGIMVDPDTEELVNTWIKLLSNGKLLKAMGETGKKIVKNEYSIEIVAKEMHSVLKKAVS
jgi:glycosyltransferase involved in cell wall biosynthesis